VKAATALTLTQDLLYLTRQFPRLRFRENTIEGLTTSEKGLLMLLDLESTEVKDALTVTGISSLLQITPAGVTHLLNPLEEQGYIERRPDPRDRRMVRICLTQRGARAARALTAEAQRQLIGLVEHLGEKDSRTLVGLLSRTVEYFASNSVD
jgi:DNA-binding MarR family transcriptional regulator